MCWYWNSHHTHQQHKETTSCHLFPVVFMHRWTLQTLQTTFDLFMLAFLLAGPVFVIDRGMKEGLIEPLSIIWVFNAAFPDRLRDISNAGHAVNGGQKASGDRCGWPSTLKSA